MATLNVKNLPDPLYDQLKRRAEQQHRSVAQEVRVILEAALGEPRPLSIMALEGLGADAWRGIDAAEYVATERASWD
jgi:plasmid stability protein